MILTGPQLDPEWDLWFSNNAQSLCPHSTQATDVPEEFWLGRLAVSSSLSWHSHRWEETQRITIRVSPQALRITWMVIVGPWSLLFTRDHPPMRQLHHILRSRQYFLWASISLCKIDGTEDMFSYLLLHSIFVLYYTYFLVLIVSP